MEIKALKDLLPYCLENCTKKTLAVIKAEEKKVPLMPF